MPHILHILSLPQPWPFPLPPQGIHAPSESCTSFQAGSGFHTHFLPWAGFPLYQDPSFFWIPGIVLIIKAAMITAIIIKPYIRIVGASLNGSMGKNLPANLGDAGSISGPGRSPGEGNEYPFQYSCLENPMDRGAWQAIVHGVAKESDTT